jgi:hypothetical protein
MEDRLEAEALETVLAGSARRIVHHTESEPFCLAGIRKIIDF